MIAPLRGGCCKSPSPHPVRLWEILTRHPTPASNSAIVFSFQSQLYRLCIEFDTPKRAPPCGTECCRGLTRPCLPSQKAAFESTTVFLRGVHGLLTEPQSLSHHLYSSCVLSLFKHTLVHTTFPFEQWQVLQSSSHLTPSAVTCPLTEHGFLVTAFKTQKNVSEP